MKPSSNQANQESIRQTSVDELERKEVREYVGMMLTVGICRCAVLKVSMFEGLLTFIYIYI